MSRAQPERRDGKSDPDPHGGLRARYHRLFQEFLRARLRQQVDWPVAELERQSNINEDVIRFLTIRVDELESGPSAMMRRGDKDRDRDRGPRGDRGDRDDRPSFRAREEEVE